MQEKDKKNEIENLDTGRGLLVNWVFGIRQDREMGLFRTYVLPYIAMVVVGFVIPLIIAFLTMDMKMENLTDPTPTMDKNIENLTKPIPDKSSATELRHITLPYLLDWNMHFALIVSVPLLVMFIVSEPRMIASGMKELKANGILQEEFEGKLYESWQGRYHLINHATQYISVVFGAIAAYQNYNAQHATDFRGWQFHPNYSTYSSWVFLCWQIPLLWSFCALYVLRFFTHICFLFDLVKRCKVKVKPFHHDNCGGLKSIGRIGLRNQYLMTAIGINILLLLYVLHILSIDPLAAKAEVSMDFNMAILGVGGVLVYLIGAPIAFLGPLLPFRREMSQAKETLLAELAGYYESIYNQIKTSCTNKQEAKEDITSIERIEKLRTIAKKFPVWPCDSTTLRKFFIALGTPLMSALITGLVGLLIHWLQKVLSA